MAQISNVIISTGGASPTGAVATPAGVAGGLLAVCHIADNDAPNLAGMTAPAGAGFAELAAFTANYVPRLKVWARPLDDAASSYTFRHEAGSGSHSWVLAAFALYDVDLDNPLVGTPGTASTPGSSSTFTGAGVTATEPGQLSVVFGAALRYNASDVGAAFFTPPTNWDERYDVGQDWMKPVLYTRRLTAAGATGAANAAISAAMSAGQSSLHVLFSNGPAAPSGPEPGRAMLAA